MQERIQLAEFPVQKNSIYKSVQITLPWSFGSTVHVGSIAHNENFWQGVCQDDNESRDWIGPVTSWYVAQVFAKALEKYPHNEGREELLLRIPDVFVRNKKQHHEDATTFVLQYVTQKEIEVIFIELPPLDYITKFVAMAMKREIIFNSEILKRFLARYRNIPDSLHKNLQDYERWRRDIE